MDLQKYLHELYLEKKTLDQAIAALEPHFEAPVKSSVMMKYPAFLARHEAVDFLADSIKVIIVGGIAPHDLEALMEQDLEVRHHDASRPAAMTDLRSGSRSVTAFGAILIAPSSTTP